MRCESTLLNEKLHSYYKTALENVKKKYIAECKNALLNGKLY
jgi:hypothetical protein